MRSVHAGLTSFFAQTAPEPHDAQRIRPAVWVVSNDHPSFSIPGESPVSGRDRAVSTGCSWCRFSRILYIFSFIYLCVIFFSFFLKKYIETTLPTPRFKKALSCQSFWWGESVHIYTRQAPFCYTGCSFRWRLWGRIKSSHAIIMPCIPFFRQIPV